MEHAELYVQHTYMYIIIMHMMNKYISVQVTAKLVSCSNPSCSLRAATPGVCQGAGKKSNILGCI